MTRRWYAGLVGVGLFSLAACTPQQLITAQSYQDKIAGVCTAANFLLPLAGPYAVWITGACATEATVAKLALDPSSLAWLIDIVAKIKTR